jgi:phospholipid/cholesterol/gamma-HCH transport system substrate-binding protein
VFVLAAVGLVVGFAVALGDLRFVPGARVLVDFHYTGALRQGAPVVLSGTQVGKVERLTLQTPSDAAPVRLELRIDADRMPWVTEDAQFHVATRGLIGEAYLELTPGGGATAGNGAILHGVDAPRFHVMSLQLEALMGDGQRLLRALVGDSDAVERAAGAIADLLSALAEANLGEAVASFRGLAEDARALTAELRAAAGGGQAQAIVTRLHAVLAQLEPATQALRGLAEATPPAEMRDTVRALRAAADGLALGTERLLRMSERVERGEGTVGALLLDSQLYDDLKALLTELRQNPWKLVWKD